MIHRGDIAATLRAWKPETTDEEITQLYQEMTTEWERLSERITHQLRQAWTNHHGQQPDGLSWGQIQDKAKQDAEVQIRAAYLDPITQEIVAQQADENDPIEEWDREQLRAALHDPEAWKTSFPYPLWASPTHEYLTEATDIVNQVWPEAATDFYCLAVDYISHRLATKQDFPTSPQDELYEKVTAMIREVENSGPERNPYGPDYEMKRKAFLSNLPG